jgi:glycosyltransferase involved in cell wall biosynthesis
VPRELPSFDLVVATVGRAGALGRLFDSLEAQEYSQLRVLVVDQNDDESVAEVVRGRTTHVLHLQSPRGLSRARNAALEHLSADVIAFPDDDCVYPPGLLQRVAERFADDDMLDGLTGRAVDAAGRSGRSWNADAATLTDDNLWNRAISYTIFLRRAIIERVGTFDEHLGLGSTEPWGSGEEIDYLVRAVRSGARIDYDPTLVVQHDIRVDDPRVGFRDGASVGYLLRKHAYPVTTVGRMLIRAAGGTAVSLARLDRANARYRFATLRGRVRGYVGASRSKISA